MKNRILFFCFLLFLSWIASNGTYSATTQQRLSKEILQDPKTKDIFYLESDECHLAALSPEGKLLWCVRVMPENFKARGFRFGGLDFWKQGNFPPLDGSKGSDCLVVSSFVGTMQTTVISRKTGAVVGSIGE